MEHRAVATLLLVENSQAVLPMWPDLRDRYMQLLVAKLEKRSPGAQTTAFLTLENMPSRYESQSSVPRQHDSVPRGLRELSFNADPQNSLTVRTIWRGADSLASTFQGQPAARHLIIVAASSPSEDDCDEYSSGSRWHHLAQKIAQAHIHCHIIVSPKPGMTRLTALFEDILRRRSFVEEPLSFPVDFRRISFRISTEPSPRHIHNSTVPQSINRALPRRNNSFPSDSYVMGVRANEQVAVSECGEATSDNPPTLVSQLQQVHGLTKKKVYGAKPTRKPFFREERVNKESTDTGSTSLPLATAGGRAPSRAKTERVLRVTQTGSPTELYGRRPRIPRRGSNVSSPETDASTSPASPVSPTNPYPPAAPIPLQHAEPSWLQMHYPPVIPPLSGSPTFTGYASTQATPSNAEGNWQTSTPSDPSGSMLAATAQSHVTSSQLSCANEPSHLESRLLLGGESLSAASRPLFRRISHPEDEEPFTFDEGYVAATATLFKNEVLPAYPNLSPLLDETAQSSPYSQATTTPRQAFYIMQDRSVPPSPTSGYDYDSYFGASYPHPFSLDYPAILTELDSPGLRYPSSYSPNSSSSITSSLTGWAG